MPRVKCASIDCKWNNDNQMCTYKKTLLLNDCSIMTLHDGRQHFHRCKAYEKSEYAKELESHFINLLESRNGYKEKGE